MQAQPYLLFEGHCEGAPESYKKTLSAKVDMVMHYKDMPEDAQPTAGQCGGMTPPLDKVMHAASRVGETQILASNGMVGGKMDSKGFGLSVSMADNVAAERTFKALGDSGHITMSMSETFFAHAFGMVTNRLGVT